MRRALLTIGKANPLAGVNIGDSFYGGYYAGIIDTTKGNIIAADQSQTGKRYALIVAPESLQGGATTYGNSGATIPTAAQTRWDGLTATTALNTSTFPAAYYCAGLAYDADGASPWYLGALDEMELAYRNLRPTASSNSTAVAGASTFPGVPQPSGYNPSSDPSGTAYTSSVPPQTTVTAFKHGGGQAFDTNAALVAFWTATMYDSADAFIQWFTGSTPGRQQADAISDLFNIGVLPVRRLYL